MKILFLTPYQIQDAPSQRFRFEQYYALLASNGWNLTTQHFLSLKDRRIMAQPQRYGRKAFALIKGYLKRVAILTTVHQFDFVFIHREAAPLGPPIFEWVIANVWKKKIIYDFDDAIWLTDNENESKWESWLRWRHKVSATCRWSHKVSCGNEYLRTYALAYKRNAILNPTTIDTEKLHNPNHYNRPKKNSVTIGWTGSSSTLKYLEQIETVLQALEGECPNVHFLVIADRPPQLRVKNLQFCMWSRQDEIKDLMKADIGIMPLPDDKWANGKCGFKALQYMALCIPTVASPVGVNNVIIENGRNGFLCTTHQEWLSTLIRLINDKQMREEIGVYGRLTVEKFYSIKSNSSNFLSLFE